jgi:DNA-binding MurR/RpiR family transcriptional regulator
VRDVGFTTETILGRHAQLAVLDLLYIAIGQRTFEQTREAIAITAHAVLPYKADDESTHVEHEQR